MGAAPPDNDDRRRSRSVRLLVEIARRLSPDRCPLLPRGSGYLDRIAESERDTDPSGSHRAPPIGAHSDRRSAKSASPCTRRSPASQPRTIDASTPLSSATARTSASSGGRRGKTGGSGFRVVLTEGAGGAASPRLSWLIDPARRS